jgi:hypothetical protein
MLGPWFSVKNRKISVVLELVMAGHFHRFSVQQLFFYVFYITFCKKRREKSNLNTLFHIRRKSYCVKSYCTKKKNENVQPPPAPEL